MGNEEFNISTLQYKEILGCVSDIYLRLDNDLNIIYGNNNPGISGFPQGITLKGNIFDLLPGLKNSASEHILYDVLEVKVRKSFEEKIEVNGETRFFKIDIYPCTQGIAILGKDITEYKEHQFTSILAEERLRITLDNITEGCAILNNKFNYLYFNDAHTKHARYTRDKLTNKNVLDLFPGFESTPIYYAFKAVLDEGVPKEITAEYTYTDNSKRWYQLKIAPVPEGIIVLSEDVTDQIVYEQSLEHYKLILSQSEHLSHTGTWWLEIDEFSVYNDNIIIQWSDEVYRIFGYPPREIVVTTNFFFSHVHSEDREAVLTAALKSRSERTSMTCEYRIERADGVLRVLKQVGEFNLDSQGKITAMVGAVMDITDFREAEKLKEQLVNEILSERDKLKLLLNEKETLLRELYHRTKNNLQVISSLLNLQAESVGNETVSAIFAEMQNRIRTISLVHEKLYRSRSLSRVDLKEYLTELITLLSGSYSNYNRNVILKTDLQAVEVLLDDAVSCGLILNELISNCYKHAFPGDRQGTITILLRKIDELIDLQVSDDGIGLSESNDKSKFGLNLFKLIAEDQLEAEIISDFLNGVSWIIRFRRKD